MWLTAKIVGLFTKATGAAVKGTVDTVKGVTDIEKNRLDIKLKKQELADKERLIQPATFEDIKEYDPKIEEIRRRVVTSSRRVDSPSKSHIDIISNLFSWLVLLAILLGLITLVMKTLSHMQRLNQ
jgi:hypothetical protein